MLEQVDWVKSFRGDTVDTQLRLLRNRNYSQLQISRIIWATEKTFDLSKIRLMCKYINVQHKIRTREQV